MLAARFRTLTYHRASYGGSDSVPGPLTIADQAAHCHALMRHLGIEQAHVAGHSSSAIPNPAEDTMATRVQARDAMQFVN